jgi:hypothetical protein
MTQLAMVFGWIAAFALGSMWLVILFKIVQGKINLDTLINEPNGGDASISRFQFLIFTFVIAMAVFLCTVGSNPPALPKIPVEVLALLGISSGSYVISKGIQTSGNVSMEKMKTQAAEDTAAAAAAEKPKPAAPTAPASPG